MQNISDILLEITGLSISIESDSELSVSKSESSEYVEFFAKSQASVANMVCNTVGSLDNLVSFAMLNNISITDINKKQKKVLFLKSNISDASVNKQIAAYKLNFVSEISLIETYGGGFLLQENGKYLLQENLFKIKL